MPREPEALVHELTAAAQRHKRAPATARAEHDALGSERRARHDARQRAHRPTRSAVRTVLRRVADHREGTQRALLERLLRSEKRVVFAVGLEARHAGAEVMQLAEAVGAPVVTRLDAKGAVDESCKDVQFKKSGQDIAFDSSCLKAQVTAKYCSDQDYVAVNVQVSGMPAVAATLKSVTCP